MNLIKLTGALVFSLLLASAPLVSGYDTAPAPDRDTGSMDQSYDSNQTYNSMGDQFDRQTQNSPEVPYGEQSSHYPPYYQSTR